MGDQTLPRPTAARPIQGLYLGSPRGFQSPLTMPAPLFRSPPSSPSGSGSSLSPSSRGPLGSLDDMATLADLDRLADERNLSDLLQYGFASGSPTLRLTLSPRGMTEDAGSPLSGDEWQAADDSKRSLGKVFGKLRKRPARPMIITSDDQE